MIIVKQRQRLHRAYGRGVGAYTIDQDGDGFLDSLKSAAKKAGQTIKTGVKTGVKTLAPILKQSAKEIATAAKDTAIESAQVAVGNLVQNLASARSGDDLKKAFEHVGDDLKDGLKAVQDVAKSTTKKKAAAEIEKRGLPVPAVLKGPEAEPEQEMSLSDALEQAEGSGIAKHRPRKNHRQHKYQPGGGLFVGQSRGDGLFVGQKK